MNRRTVLFAALVVGIGNAVPLGTVLWDRSGTPRSVTEFSVRELAWSYTDNENTGITLDWNWHRSSIDSVSDELLDSLGLSCRPAGYVTSCRASQPGYVVVGIDTAGWRADSARRARALDSLVRAGSKDTAYTASEVRGLVRESRLAVLDAALDRASLEAKWGGRWPVLPAELGTWWYAEASRDQRTRGISVQMMPGKLYLPSSLHGATRDGRQYRWNDSVPESFATVTVGRAGLPRITAVRWSEGTKP